LSYRDVASFGKRQEYFIVANLLKRNYDVYLTLVDDKQIDCIVRKGDKKPRYVDIQIKARSKDCDPKNAARFAGLKIENPRENYFFIFYSEQLEKIWVIPSLDIINEIGSINKKGKNKGKYNLNMAGYSAKKGEAIGDGITTKRYVKYEDAKGFELLDKILDKE
jgi:hypothetical protein